MKKKGFLFLSLLVISIIALASIPKSKMTPSEIPERSAAFAASDWSTPVNISNTENDSFSPRIGVDSNEKAYVAWVDWTDGPRAIYFNTNKSGQWPSAQRVHSMVSSSNEAAFPALATSPEGICHLIFHDVVESFDILYYQYNNGWSSAANVSQTPEGGSVYSTLALSPTDNYLYAIWMDDAVNIWDLMYRYKNPDTNEWEVRDIISLFGGMQYMPSATVDGKGTLHLVFITRDDGNSTVWYVKNPQPRNNSQWTQPAPVSVNVGVEWSYPKIACDDNGDVYIVWNGTSSQGNRDVFLRKTVNQIWKDQENVSLSQDLSEGAAIAVNRSTGEFYVGWQENVGGTNWEVYIKAFEQERAGAEKKWMSADNISNNTSVSGWPSIAVAENGDLHVAFIDRTPGNLDIYYTNRPKIRIYPPTNVTLQTSYNKVLFYTEKINTITFTKNSANDDELVASYKLYRKKAAEGNDQFQLLATLTPSTFTYDDRQLSLTEKYSYALTTVDTDGNESKMSDSVTEN